MNIRHAFFATAILASLSSGAQATTFINLSDKTVYLARADYEPYSSQPDVTPARYSFRGWNRVAPGAVVRVSQGWMYVKNSRGQGLSWPKLNKMTGVIKNGRFNNAYVAKRDSRRDLDRLVRQGYRKATYQYFGNGTYTISGSAFRIVKREYNFSHESRSLKFLSQRYRPGGAVAGYSIRYSDNKWANVKWGIQNDGLGVYYGGSIEGKQVRTFGPREPAKFKGKVIVHYVR